MTSFARLLAGLLFVVSCLLPLFNLGASGIGSLARWPFVVAASFSGLVSATLLALAAKAVDSLAAIAAGHNTYRSSEMGDGESKTLDSQGHDHLLTENPTVPDFNPMLIVYAGVAGLLLIGFVLASGLGR